MEYRRDIDGLRSVAVLPVILFHAGFSIFSGGFVGVDVFFVISGYLITGILITELQAGRYSILHFYERRARRILPALFVVMAASTVMAMAWMLPAVFEQYSRSLAAVPLFGSNILFWREDSYFAPPAELKPLLHTWSLAVEEQYYLLFPLFLAMIWRFGRRRVQWMILAVFLVSLGICEWGWRHSPHANFYLAPSRAWELLAGSLCAFLVSDHAPRPNQIFSAAGLIMILYAIFAFDRSTPFPSLYAMLPVGGAALILLFSGPATVTGWILSSRPMVGVGLISYSAYLWHQPLFALARIRSLVEPGQGVMALLAAGSIGLAALTWRFVEQPFRRRPVPLLASRSRLFLASATVGGLFILLGLAGMLTAGLPGRLPAGAVLAAGFAEDRNPQVGMCEEDTGRYRHPVADCATFMLNGRADVIFMGDSHSQALSLQAQEALAKRGIASYAASYSGCVGLSGFFRPDEPPSHDCDAYNRDMLGYARQIGAHTLVITSRFPLYYTGQWSDNGDGGREIGPPAYLEDVALRSAPRRAEDPARQTRVLEIYRTDLEALAKEFTVVLVDPIPEPGWNVPETLAKCLIFGSGPCDLSTDYGVYQKRVAEVEKVFDSIDSPRLIRVRTAEILCPEDAVPRRCDSVRNGLPLYFDDDHLANSTGAELMAGPIAQAVTQAMAEWGLPAKP